MTENTFEFLDFTATKFFSTIRDRSKGHGSGRSMQTEYMFDYLQKSGVSSMVLESHYIDRHYMKEYTTYYSSCFNAVTNYTSRLHFFVKLGVRDIEKYLQSVSSENFKDVKAQLSKSYLGFVTIRPMPTIAIGRTVLDPLKYSYTEDRHFPATRPYNLHFFGIPLRIKGLAFQQQDQGVAACATTAIWSALQQACINDGMRPPTAPEITEAATQFFIPGGREYPSTGLTVEQACEAIRAFDLAPQLLSPEFQFERFKACIYSYLFSEIPIILLLRKPQTESGHAVTVVGYELRCKEKVAGASRIPISYRGKPYYNIGCVGSQIDKLYIHDDRIGPYARALVETAEVEERGAKTRRLVLKISAAGGEETWIIDNAIIPLYPKLRMSALGIINFSAGVTPYIAEYCASKNYDRLCIEVFFKKAGDYAELLHQKDFESKYDFMKRLSASRYAGILRFYLDGSELCDFILDTTDTDRSHNIKDYRDLQDSPFLAVVNYCKEFREVFSVLRRTIDILGN